MFSIKICGVTTAADAKLVADAGADAIGINFYPKSLRCVTVDQALEIVEAVGSSLQVVGVFVNFSASQIKQRLRECPLDVIQLHGDESPDILEGLEDRPVLRALRWNSIEQVRAEGQHWLDQGAAGLLLDAVRGAQYGGTGATLDWNQVAELEFDAPVVLAGGLSPENVADAIRVTRPAGVDVASGVEKFPGQKDPDAVREFILRAAATFETL